MRGNRSDTGWYRRVNDRGLPEGSPALISCDTYDRGFRRYSTRAVRGTLRTAVVVVVGETRGEKKIDENAEILTSSGGARVRRRYLDKATITYGGVDRMKCAHKHVHN